MKKIFSLIMAVALSMTTVFAQSHVVSPTLFDGWSVGVFGTTYAPLNHAFDWANHSGLNNWRAGFGVEVGKSLTPITSLSVTDEINFNSTGVKTVVDENLMVGNVAFNLNNLFFGYREGRKFEVSLVPGIGWYHMYAVTNVPHTNYVAYRGGVAFTYNVNDALSFTLKPAVTYIDRFRAHNATAGLAFGATWRIKGRNSNTRSFELCPYTVTQETYDAALARINELESRPVEVKEVVKEVEKVVEVPAVSNTTTVTFAFNSSKLSDDAKAALDAIPTNATVIVDAYSSLHGGTTRTNQIVSDARAKAVTDYLVSRGVKVDSTNSHGAVDEFIGTVAVVTIK